MKVSKQAQFALVCLALVCSTPAFAQHISAGVKAGMPLTGVLPFNYLDLQGSYAPSESVTKRYSVGPVLDIEFRKFGIEAAAEYKRIDQQATKATIIGYVPLPDDDRYAILEKSPVSGAGGSWEFPITGHYSFSTHHVRSYVESGVSFNHLTGLVMAKDLRPLFSDPIYSPQYSSNSANRIGIVFGAGLAPRKFSLVHVTPGLRYTLYRATTFPWQDPFAHVQRDIPLLPRSNVVEFTLGFTH